MVVAGANFHDTKLLALTLDSIVVERRDTWIQHLCLDKEYDNPTGHKAVAAYGYRGHIRHGGGWQALWPGYPSAGRSKSS